MAGEAQIQLLEQKVNALIGAETDLFLVEIKIKPTNNIKVFVDGDQGVSIEKLVQYNRKLYKQIEEEVMFPGGDFSLEVSSPGLEEPLKLHRQYVKNIGRFVEVVDLEGVKIEGKLTAATEDAITVEEIKARLTGKNKNMEVGQGKGKKMETIHHNIPLAGLKTIKVQIKF